MLYFHSPSQALKAKPKRLSRSDGTTLLGSAITDAALIAEGYLPFTEPAKSANQKYGGIITTANSATREVIDLSQQEIDAAARERKLKEFKNAFELLSRISIAVFEKLRADGLIAPTDFPADIRQAYQDYKVLMDELFPQ